MSANFIYEPVTANFINQSSLTINHNFGRPVNVQIKDSFGSVVITDVVTDNNDVIAKFYVAGQPYLFSGEIVVS